MNEDFYFIIGCALIPIGLGVMFFYGMGPYPDYGTGIIGFF